MANFTSIFIDNFFGIIGLNSALPSTSTGIGTSSAITGIESIEESTGLTETGVGTSLISTGAAISTAGLNAYEKTINQLELTQAYVESLDEEELTDFIEKLEAKNAELSTNENKEKTLEFRQF